MDILEIPVVKYPKTLVPPGVRMFQESRTAGVLISLDCRTPGAYNNAGLDFRRHITRNSGSEYDSSSALMFILLRRGLNTIYYWLELITQFHG